MRVICSPSLLSGELEAIPSKSDAHRILISAALADEETKILINGQLSEDIIATMNCLIALGADIKEENDGLLVRPIKNIPPTPVLDCGESGSTLRFLLPVAAALGANAKFIGSGRLPKRPIDSLVSALREGGVSVNSDRLPLSLKGRLSSKTYTLPGNISSQFISGFLFALPLLEGGGEIVLKHKLESAAYVDMTIDTLAKFSVNIEVREQAFVIPPSQSFISPKEIKVEGDWSNMAFFLTAGALGGPVSVKGLLKNTLQGDSKIFTLLSSFGANSSEKEGAFKVKKDVLKGINNIDAREIPDLVPILAVAASLSEGRTKISGAARLRIKESDRLQTVRQMLEALGGRVQEGEDYLIIDGQPTLSGGQVDCSGDHRIAMAAAIGATVCEGETILHGAEAVHKSYPNFFEDYKNLGGICHVINDG